MFGALASHLGVSLASLRPAVLSAGAKGDNVTRPSGDETRHPRCATTFVAPIFKGEMNKGKAGEAVQRAKHPPPPFCPRPQTTLGSSFPWGRGLHRMAFIIGVHAVACP